MKYSEQRIPTLNEYCVVCDEQHVFQNGSMLKVMRKMSDSAYYIDDTHDGDAIANNSHFLKVWQHLCPTGCLLRFKLCFSQNPRMLVKITQRGLVDQISLYFSTEEKNKKHNSQKHNNHQVQTRGIKGKPGQEERQQTKQG